jgi:hypothetical protein
MRTLLVGLLVLVSGCYETLGSPVVTDVKYDDQGRLMVTRCEVGALFFVWGGSYKIDEKSCRFERPTPPAPASSR